MRDITLKELLERISNQRRDLKLKVGDKPTISDGVNPDLWCEILTSHSNNYKERVEAGDLIGLENELEDMLKTVLSLISGHGFKTSFTYSDLGTSTNSGPSEDTGLRDLEDEKLLDLYYLKLVSKDVNFKPEASIEAFRREMLERFGLGSKRDCRLIN